MNTRARIVVAMGITLSMAAACTDPSTAARTAVVTGGASPAATCRSTGVADLTVFRGAGGTCLPPSRLFGYRCDPQAAPVIVRGAGTIGSRRYLGGRFAVPVAELPPDARALDGGSQVFTIRKQPDHLYVVRDDGVERWLPLPDAPPAPPPTGFVIGDSIADGAEPFITQSLGDWTLGFDAVIGRSSSSAIVPAQAQGLAQPPPDVVVVELGTNDADPLAFRENETQTLDALRSVPFVLLQTTHGPMAQLPEVNREIHALAGRYPNAAVADWDTFVHDDWLSSDGVHPLVDHEDAMAQLISPILREWWEAVQGGGPVACESGRYEQAARANV